jgi:flagellar basal body P-ring formation protein FlgA
LPAVGAPWRAAIVGMLAGLAAPAPVLSGAGETAALTKAALHAVGLQSERAAEPGHATLPPGPFTREQLLADLGRDLAAHFNLTGDLQLELLRPWTPPASTGARWTLEVLEYPLAPSSSMLLRCRIAADGAPVGDYSLLLRAALWRDAWASRQPLAPGTMFESSLLDVRRIDFLRERDIVPAGSGDARYEFARNVPAGRLITWRDLSRRPLVRKGELVDVAATEGVLLITMKAVAMENGAQGDTIVLRNPESRKNFSALVIDENRVQVRF